MEEKRVSKYRNGGKYDNVVVDCSDTSRIMISCEAVHKISKEDASKSYKSINLIKGFKSNRGFSVNMNSFNHVLNLPVTLTHKDWDEIVKAYFEQVEALK